MTTFNEHVSTERLYDIFQLNEAEANEAFVLPAREAAALATECLQRRAADKNYFMYGIADGEGKPHLDEFCVSTDLGLIENEVAELNAQGGDYSVVALYTVIPITNTECEELQQYRDGNNMLKKFEALANESPAKVIGYEYRMICGALRRVPKFADRVISQAVRDIFTERDRQITEEGWTPEHDDTYTGGELANAAGCYSLHAYDRVSKAPIYWPFPSEWWKPSNPRRSLIKAGALIIAELERMYRAKGETAECPVKEA